MAELPLKISLSTQAAVNVLGFFFGICINSIGTYDHIPSIELRHEEGALWWCWLNAFPVLCADSLPFKAVWMH